MIFREKRKTGECYETAFEHCFYFLNLSVTDVQPFFNRRHAKSTRISHFLDGYSRLTAQQMHASVSLLHCRNVLPYRRLLLVLSPSGLLGDQRQRSSNGWVAASVSFGKKMGVNLKQSVGFFMGCVGWQPSACKGMQGYRQCFFFFAFF